MTLALAFAFLQTMPDTSLRLRVGDSWETEAAYHFRGEDIDQTQVEVTRFVVVRVGRRETLRAEWKLRETRIDGQTVPAPKGAMPVVRMVSMDGEESNLLEGTDVQRHRIERAVAIERKGNLAEPSFFPVPPHVRIVGLKRIVEMDLRNKEKPLIAVAIQESAGEKPLKGIGYYSLEPKSGILLEGTWTLQNCPIPGGNPLCEVEVSMVTRKLKLAPRS